jgi:hypothetical protein
MSEAGGMIEQAITSAAASVRGPSSWEYSGRKHCEVLTIPLDLRETGWMLLKLKKFVNAVCMCSNTAKILPQQPKVTEDLGDGKDAQELACAHKGV